jgi:hypothetical protein
MWIAARIDRNSRSSAFSLSAGSRHKSSPGKEVLNVHGFTDAYQRADEPHISEGVYPQRKPARHLGGGPVVERR